MYCEGGRSRTGELAEKPKPGIGRLALESGAPIVPVAIHGSSKVRNWKRLQFPKVTSSTATRSAASRSRTRRATSSRRSPSEIFEEIKMLYAGLEQLGRRGVMERVREERRALRRAKRKRVARA